MASTTHTSLECDYLHSHLPPSPHDFTSKQAELVYINEQISSLDNHISQLNSLRRALHHRSSQLHNLFLPIQSLPVEVLSHIFQQITGREGHRYDEFYGYYKCLKQALALSSVSAHFRHAALCTPELWRSVTLLTARSSIGQLSSLLQHCVTLAPSVDIFVYDTLNEEEASSAVATLLTSEVTQRIKTFILTSPFALNIWTKNLNGSSFPMLDHLAVSCPKLNLDLRTLSTVTRLELHHPSPYYQIFAPPSVRYLLLHGVGPQAFVSFLYHCPNLQECLASQGGYFRDAPLTQFDRPLTLTHLKHLRVGFTDVIMTLSSAQNLRLPSLEYLRFKHYNAGELDGFLLLCHNVSATLTTLKIELAKGTAFEYDDDLYQLCSLPFTNLRKLKFNCDSLQAMLRVLTRRAEECNDAVPGYFPSLAALTLKFRNCDDLGIRSLLGLLDSWRVGEVSYFDLRVKGFNFDPGDWSPEEKEALRLIVGNRQIGITWNGTKVQ